MIDPRKLIRGLLKMVRGNAEKSYGARNSISINPTGIKAQYPTVAEYDVIAPDEARNSYKKVMLDPAKAYVDHGSGLSSTTIETPGAMKSISCELVKVQWVTINPSITSPLALLMRMGLSITTAT